MAALPAGLEPGRYDIDASHSEVGFTVRHAMISKTRGRFGAVTGTMVFGEDAATSTAEASIDVTSIDTRDANRDGHLRSGDFFDAEQFPAIIFRSTGLRLEDGDHLLDGELTIKGVTKPITIAVEYNGSATDPFGANRAGFSGETEISREAYGLSWNAALETGGVLIGDKVKIHLEIEGVRAAA